MEWEQSEQKVKHSAMTDAGDILFFCNLTIMSLIPDTLKLL